MRKLFVLLLISSALNGFTQVRENMSPSLTFDEHPRNHNMHIASDGKFYYTINGGQSDGKINKFDLKGQLLATYPIMIDGRGLSWNEDDHLLYASTYLGDVVRIDDPEAGKYTVLHARSMQNDQCSFALSPDGKSYYDYYKGTLRIHDLRSGEVTETITGFSSGEGNYGGDAAVAFHENEIYTWNSFTREVFVYDLKGVPVKTIVLEKGDNGHSLSICNNMLFVSRDGNYAIGTWYGYPLPHKKIQPEVESVFNLYPNPTLGSYTIQGTASRIQVVNSSGERIITLENCSDNDVHVIDMYGYAKGTYFVMITDLNDKVVTRTVILQ